MSEIQLGPIRISGSVLLALGFWCWLGDGTLIPLFLLSAALHELGHLTAARILGVPVDCLRVTWTGAELRTFGLQPFWVDGLVLLAGPGANLIQAVVCVRLDHPILAGTAVILGCFNLLPVSPLDGGELARLLAERFIPFPWNEWLSFAIGTAVAAALCLMGIFAWTRYGGGLVLTAAGCVLLIEQLRREREGLS